MLNKLLKFLPKMYHIPYTYLVLQTFMLFWKFLLRETRKLKQMKKIWEIHAEHCYAYVMILRCALEIAQ